LTLKGEKYISFKMLIRTRTVFFLSCLDLFSVTSPLKADEIEQEASATHKEVFTNPERNFKKLIEELKKRYFDSTVTEEDFYRYAVEGIVVGLNNSRDSRAATSKLMGPMEHKKWRTSSSEEVAEEVVGIGIELGFDPNTGIGSVDGVYPNLVADQGGILRGDKILEVNGKSFEGKTIEDMISVIRGKEGETVQLLIRRGNQEITKSLVRKRISVNKNEVASHIFDDLLGYLEIDAFSKKTPTKIKLILENFKQAGVKGLVIDLRKCNGGEFDSITEVLGYFLPPETEVCKVEGRDTSQVSYKTQGTPILSGIPVTLLIDKRTTSGAEIFVIGLSENSKVTLIGQATEGWSDIQGSIELENGFVFFYTNGLIKTSKGHDFRNKGIQPDIKIKNPAHPFDITQANIPLAQQLKEDNALSLALKHLREEL